MNETPSYTSSRKKTLLLAAAGLLVILILGGVWLATRSDPAQQATTALSGAAIAGLKETRFVDPPGFLGHYDSYWVQPFDYRGANLWLHLGDIESLYSIGDDDFSARGLLLGITQGWGDFQFELSRVNIDNVTAFEIRGKDDERIVAPQSDSSEAGVMVLAVDSRTPPEKITTRLWRFINAGSNCHDNGCYMIYNYTTGLCLDFEDGSLKEGSMLIQASCDASRRSQLFSLDRE